MRPLERSADSFSERDIRIRKILGPRHVRRLVKDNKDVVHRYITPSKRFVVFEFADHDSLYNYATNRSEESVTIHILDVSEVAVKHPMVAILEAQLRDKSIVAAISYRVSSKKVDDTIYPSTVAIIPLTLSSRGCSVM